MYLGVMIMDIITTEIHVGLQAVSAHLQGLPHAVALQHYPLPPLVSSARTVRQERCATHYVLQSLLELGSGTKLTEMPPSSEL